MSVEFDEDYVSNYLFGIFEDPSESQIDAAFDAMNRYEDDWWEHEDNRVRAGYQVFEDILLMPVDTYKEGLSALLRRPVSQAELERNRDQLQEEVRDSIPQLENLGLLYREKTEVKQSQVAGLETSLDAADDVIEELSDRADIDKIKEETDKDSSGSDYRIK